MTELRQRMWEELQRRNYSKETICLYLFAVEDFARRFKKRPASLTQKHMREFHFYLLNDRKLAVETVAAWITALRFFFVKNCTAVSTTGSDLSRAARAVADGLER
jgi:integrase/recombinase XerD